MGIGLDANTFSIALIGGFLVSLAWPSALMYRDAEFTREDVSPVVFMSGISGGTLIRQIVLTGGPVALAAIGGAPADVTALFSALAIFRAPCMISTGLTVRFTGSLTRLALHGSASQVRRLFWGTTVVAVAAAPAAAVFGVVVGPAISRSSSVSRSSSPRSWWGSWPLAAHWQSLVCSSWPAPVYG